jgi:hypothetical protein
MLRPTKQQITAAATLLAREWDIDRAKGGGLAEAYTEWGAGVADVIIHGPPLETLVEYLGVLEEQLGVAVSPRAERARWAEQLTAAVRAAAYESSKGSG